jgi:hypothetical protein
MAAKSASVKAAAKHVTVGEKPIASAAKDAAPDLEILGDNVTLHPSGYIEAPGRRDGREHALVAHAAKFRTAPLE